MELYPRLRGFEAKPLIEEYTRAPLSELEREHDLLPRGIVWAATGGVRVRDVDLGRLRTSLRTAAASAGYRYGAAEFSANRAERLRMDHAISRVLFTTMRLTPNEASNGEVWRYVACILAPEIVRWRFAGEETTSAERYGISLRRNMFARLWWRALTFEERGASDPWWLFDSLGEDEMVQITERPRAAGYRLLARALAKNLLKRHDPTIHPNRSEILRDVMKRLLRRLPLLRYETLEHAELVNAVDDLYADTFTAMKLEPSRQVGPLSAHVADDVGLAPDDEPTDEVFTFDELFPDSDPAPLGRTTTGRPVPNGMATNPPDLSDQARSLLSHIGAEWSAKFDILSGHPLTDAAWLAAVGELVSMNMVESRGEKRGRRYRLAPGAADIDTSPPLASREVPSLAPRRGTADPKQQSATPTPPRSEPVRPAPVISTPFRTDPVKDALVDAAPELGKQPCMSCQRRMPLFVGKQGPFLRCAECEQSFRVAPRLLQRALALNPHWRCKECDGSLTLWVQGDRTSLSCSSGHIEAWPSLRDRLRSNRSTVAPVDPPLMAAERSMPALVGEYHGDVPAESRTANAADSQITERSLGHHALNFYIVTHLSGQFSHRLVFGGVRLILAALGVKVQAIQTSDDGRGAELAIAVGIDTAPAMPLAKTVELVLASTADPKFNHLLILRSAREVLASAGLVIRSMETTAGGHGDDIAIRIRTEAS